MAPRVGNRGCPRRGFRGIIGKMVSFTVEEGWPNLRGFQGENPICDGGGWIEFNF